MTNTPLGRLLFVLCFPLVIVFWTLQAWYWACLGSLVHPVLRLVSWIRYGDEYTLGNYWRPMKWGDPSIDSRALRVHQERTNEARRMVGAPSGILIT